MEYCKRCITLVGVADSAVSSFEHIGGVTVRRDPRGNWNDIQFKTHKLRMTVDGLSIRNTINRKYVRVPYEWVYSVDIR